jgi:hypothetical protein
MASKGKACTILCLWLGFFAIYTPTRTQKHIETHKHTKRHRHKHKQWESKTDRQTQIHTIIRRHTNMDTDTNTHRHKHAKTQTHTRTNSERDERGRETLHTRVLREGNIHTLRETHTHTSRESHTNTHRERERERERERRTQTHTTHTVRKWGRGEAKLCIFMKIFTVFLQLNLCAFNETSKTNNFLVVFYYWKKYCFTILFDNSRSNKVIELKENV